MARFGVDEIGLIEERIMDNLLAILTKLNREDKIEDFLEYCGLSDLLNRSEDYEVFKDGKILVIGESRAKKDDLYGIVKNLGIDKARLEMCLEYEDAKTYDFSHIQYNPGYSVILVGPMPHSAVSKGNHSSVIAALKAEDGYPPVISLGTNELKITKSNFRNAMECLLDESIIT